MSRVQAILEATDWLGGLGDQSFVDGSYTDIVQQLARQTTIFSQFVVLNTEPDINRYTVSADAIDIEAVVAYPNELPKTDSTGLDLSKVDWMQDTGTPVMWFEDGESRNTFRVYPTPETGGMPGISTLIAPGAGVTPDENLIVFFRAVPQENDVHEWLDGLLAVRLASREAMRLGTTQDLSLMKTLDQVSEVLTTLLLRSEPT